MTNLVEILERALRGDLAWPATAGWEPQALVDLASEHGVEALLWAALQSMPDTAGDVGDILAPHVLSAVARDILAQRDMRTVLEALAAVDVQALVIKGSALAYTVYSEPWHRPRTDTDLLIRPGDTSAASSVLEQCGYRRSDALTSGTFVSHQVAFERDDDRGMHHVIDLHWKIVNPQILANVLPFEDLWRERQPVPALTPAAWVPSPVNGVVLSSIHRLAHHQGQDRLIWLYDLRLLTRGFGATEWDQLRQLACRRRVAGLCLDGLLQARDRLGADLPATIEAALRLAAPGEPSHRYLEGMVHRRDVLSSDLGALSWSDRLRLLREHAFPPPAFIRQRYGVRSALLLPALYLHRLVTGAYKWVRP